MTFQKEARAAQRALGDEFFRENSAEEIFESGYIAGREAVAPSAAATTEEREALARALNAAGWTCQEGSDEPGRYDECEDCRRVSDQFAGRVLAEYTRPVPVEPTRSVTP